MRNFSGSQGRSIGDVAADIVNIRVRVLFLLIIFFLLLIYAYIASTLPVQTLLQPRDYINGHPLFVALGLLGLGVIVAHPTVVAPAANLSPQGAPPMWPMLFVIGLVTIVLEIWMIIESVIVLVNVYGPEKASEPQHG